MYKEYEQYLENILDECNYLVQKFPPELNKDQFLANEDFKRLAENALMRIGEIIKKIPADIKLKWNLIEWRKIAGMRDKLIHDYLGTDYTIVWNTVRIEIPKLKSAIEKILHEGN
jgi:uncharacterized protein with HEPN domain